MAVDRNAPELMALRVLLHEQSWAKLEAAIDGRGRVEIEAEGIHHYLRTHPMSESDRLLLSLAYSLWRGFGPTVDVHAIWGMDPTVASKVLASLAAAVDPENAGKILRASIALVEPEPLAQEEPRAEDDGNASTGTKPDGRRRKPKLAVARE